MKKMVVLDRVYAYGHENILCTHTTTIEITKDDTLTTKGNCILGINSSKACYSLDSILKEQIKAGRKFTITIKADDYIDTFCGFGDNSLELSSKKDIVFRKSNYICDRTVLINCNKSSMDLNRDLIDYIKRDGKKFEILFELNESDNNE